MTFTPWWIKRGIVLLAACLLGACGGGGGGSSSPPPADPAPVITSQPSDAQVVVGADARFEATAQGNAITWTWQRSSDSGATWLAAGSPVTSTSGNSSTAFLNVTGVNLSADNSRYRAVASNTGGQVTTSAATLTVQSQFTPASISVQPVSQQATEGGSATFAVTAAGTALQYQWQNSLNGTAWANVAGATAPTLQLQGLAVGASGTQYRVVVSNSSTTVTSGVAILTVTVASAAPAFTLQPLAASVTAPNTATFSVAATGQPTPSIQWQRSNSAGGTFTNISGATAASYTTPATTLADNGSVYRAQATNSAGTATSTAASLGVTSAGTPPALTSQPTAVTVAQGQTATLTAVVSGTPTPTLQWQVSANGGVSFANINGATSSSYSLLTAAADNGNRYRVVATNSVGTVTSQAALLTVTSPTSSRNASQYWLAGVAGFGADAVLYIVDPALPNQPLFSRSVAETVSIWSAVEISSTSGRGGRVVTTSSDVSWIEGGRMQYLSLLRTAPSTPRQLTQATDFCFTFGGSRIWRNGVEIESHLAQRAAGCNSASGGQQYVYAPSTAQASDAAPVGWSNVPQALDDWNGASSIVLAMEPGPTAGTFELGVFRKDGSRLGPVSGAGSFTSATWFPLGLAEVEGNTSPALFGSGLAGDRVRRLSWTAGSASLGPNLYTLVTGRSGGNGLASDASFFADGTAVLALNPGASSPSTLFSVPANSALTLLPSATRISAAVTPTQACPTARQCLQVLTTARTGGTPTTYTFEGTATQAPVALTSGYETDQLAIVQRTDAGLSNVLTLDLRTGTVRTVVAAAVYVGATIRSQSRVGGASEWTGVLFCEPASGTSCAGRAIKQRSLDGLSTVDLGTAPASLSSQPSWLLYDDMPNAVNFSVTGLFSHLYVVTPGVAGSLRLIAGL